VEWSNPCKIHHSHKIGRKLQRAKWGNWAQDIHLSSPLYKLWSSSKVMSSILLPYHNYLFNLQFISSVSTLPMLSWFNWTDLNLSSLQMKMEQKSTGLLYIQQFNLFFVEIAFFMYLLLQICYSYLIYLPARFMWYAISLRPYSKLIKNTGML